MGGLKPHNFLKVFEIHFSKGASASNRNALIARDDLTMPKKKRSEAETMRRRILASILLGQRSLDRGYEVKPGHALPGQPKRYWYKWDTPTWHRLRGVSEYEATLNLTGKNSVNKIVKRKISELRRPVRVLDVGCGYGIFLHQLAKTFKNRVELEGLTLARPLPPSDLKRIWQQSPSPIRKDKQIFESLLKYSEQFHRMLKEYNVKVHVGNAEKFKYGKEYDLIFSVYSFIHFPNPEKALMNTLSHLSKGGEAYIHTGAFDPTKSPMLSKWLEENNIIVQKLTNDAYMFKKLPK